jgi:hypothetical protein
MTQLGEAIARYHKIIESDRFRDQVWVEELRSAMQQRNLYVSGRWVSPFLRPNFVSKRQYTNLVKAAESLSISIDRVRKLALSSPALMSRMEMLPAEKMLASVDPGYTHSAVTGLLDTHLNNGTLRFLDCSADTPAGLVYGEVLADLFYECGPVKEFRKRYALTKSGGVKQLHAALLKAWKEFGGKTAPNIGILEFRQPFASTQSNEYQLLLEYFQKQGYAAEVVSPEQLEYRGGVLRRGDFPIQLVYRQVKVHEFLIHYDLSHPLVRAYRERKVCVVNSFRSELGQKKAVFELLTDEAITAGFPAAERKVIREYIPWTRVVAAAKTTWHEQTVDLPDFILKNREKLVLRPNDESGEQNSFEGALLDDGKWERAVRTALRAPYVVQERVAAPTAMFPVKQYGDVEMKEMRIEVQPHIFLGKVQGCSSWLTTAANQAFSSLAGPAPTYIIEEK